MEAGQEMQPNPTSPEQPYEESVEQENAQEEYVASEDTHQLHSQGKQVARYANGENRSGFVHGLSVGLGVGCIATFVIVWVSLFFTPQMPATITYENLLSIFIYPLVYLLAVGLIALTAGVVREYYSLRTNS